MMDIQLTKMEPELIRLMKLYKGALEELKTMMYFNVPKGGTYGKTTKMHSWSSFWKGKNN